MSERVLEYATYVASGTRCIKCGYPIKNDQLASRVSLGEKAGYRHLVFNECQNEVNKRLAKPGR